METKKPYIKPEILIEEWKVYKTTVYNKKQMIYEVSNLGRVKVNGTLHIFDENKKSYFCIGTFRVHRAVAELFIPNPENKPCVDHIDTNPHNNIVWNLRWVTYKENNNNPLTKQHMYEGSKGKKFSEETKQKRKKVAKELWNNLEYRQKISEARKDRTYINKDNVRRLVKNEQLESFLNNGWKLGMK